MKNKNIIAKVVSIVLILSTFTLIGITASANDENDITFFTVDNDELTDNTENTESKKTTFNFTVGDAWVGEQLTVTLAAENMVGLTSANLVFDYDSEYFEYIDIEKCPDSDMYLSTGGINFDGELTFAFIYYYAATKDSDLCQITFRVLKAGTSEISVTCLSWDGTTMPNDTYVSISAVEKNVNKEENSYEEITTEKTTTNEVATKEPINTTESVSSTEIASDNSSNINCTHMCHSKNCFIRFWWNIINLFNKIFHIEKNHYCSCGIDHW